MAVAPCKNCEMRKIPKTCEKNCQLWQEYEAEHIEELKRKKFNRKVDGMINSCIWKNK